MGHYIYNNAYIGYYNIPYNIRSYRKYGVVLSDISTNSTVYTLCIYYKERGVYMMGFFKGNKELSITEAQAYDKKATFARMINEKIADAKETGVIDSVGGVSDGYHTFDELYHHRAILFASICNLMPHLAWKSKLHADGTMYDDMFIVGVDTAEGNATYHYDINPYWDTFNVEELEKAPEFDGHTPEIALERILNETKLQREIKES